MGYWDDCMVVRRTYEVVEPWIVQREQAAATRALDEALRQVLYDGYHLSGWRVDAESIKASFAVVRREVERA